MVQRVTAIYIVTFILAIILYTLISPPADYTSWLSLVQQPLVNTSILLCLVFLLIHSWIGMRDVVMDYVKPLWLRLTLLLLVVTYLASCFIFGIRILFRVVFT